MSDYGSTPPPPPPPGSGDAGYGGGSYSAPPPAGGPMGTPPDNKLVWSILVTLFCCLPFGIVAIIKSAEVNSKWAAGDHAGAQQSAADAGKWIKWGAIAGVIVIVLYLVFVVGLGILGASTSSSGM
ncbi:CD225/dispanin family protein [Nostocoides sp. Soil756]|jgi:hypothetical protein|uniref:CD225/dispanin family protein n=1 Tax=Nostocoides sp. Soil756 TaxID=1736399 RepID=UPI0006FACDA9|nr:CD225/dispanin family protein [Tetrasphaera sp. Soil756]KRE60049.1 hypothetical protein ASG78_15105 [Tetrasphaera sp. Soil756]